MRRFIATGIIGGILGAIVFWLYQSAFQGASIPAFIGNQVVSQGKYDISPPLVGWAVHLWVSISYAFILALLMQILFPKPFILNRVLGLVVALILGWAATLIASPAIQVTIGILAGKGFPEKLVALNPASGHPLWNHLLFFVVIWVVDSVMALAYKKN